MGLFRRWSDIEDVGGSIEDGVRIYILSQSVVDIEYMVYSSRIE